MNILCPHASLGRSVRGSTRNRVPPCSIQRRVVTVEFGFTSTVAHRQAGTRWDLETQHNEHLLRSAVVVWSEPVPVDGDADLYAVYTESE